MFTCLAAKLWQIHQIARIGFLATLILCLTAAAHAQSGPAVPVPQQELARRKTAQNGSADQTFTLLGAGDIATCKHLQSAEATAKLIEGIPGTVFAAGDLAYDKGTPEQFKDCYDAA